MSEPNGRVRITVSPAMIAVIITLAATVGGGIWTGSELAATIGMLAARAQEDRGRIAALETESNRRVTIIQEFRDVQRRVDGMEANEATLAAISVSIAKLEEQMQAVRASQDEIKRRLEQRASQGAGR